MNSIESRRAARIRALISGPMAIFIARTVVPGAIATGLMAAGSVGVGWIPADSALNHALGIPLIRGSQLGVIASIAMVLFGAVLLVHTWLVLGSDVRARWVADPRWLAGALAAWAVPLLFSPPMFSRDVYSYVAQGRIADVGLDPYVQGPASLPRFAEAGVDPTWSSTASPYGQLFVVLSERVGELAGPATYLAAILFRFLALGGVALLVWAVPVLARAFGVDPARALWLGVLNPLLLIHFVAGAHNDAIMIGLIAAGFAVAVRGRPVSGVLLVALGGAVKPIGLLALPFAAVIWAGVGAPVRRIAWRTVGAGAIGTVVLVFLAIATGTGWGWLQTLGTPGEVRTWLSPPTAIGMIMGAAFDPGNPDIGEEFITVARALGMLIGVAAIAWLCLRPSRLTPVAAAAVGFLVLIACAPAVQPWYFLWVLPLLAVTPLTRLQERWVVWLSIALVIFSVGSHFNDGRVFA